MRGVAGIRRTAALCFLVLAVGCANADEPKRAPTPSSPPDSATTCIDASEGGLPYSFCVPDTWSVGDVVHSDGRVDIGMVDGTGQILGFGGAISPVAPSGRLNRIVPFPEEFINARDRRRFLGEVGFEPHAVRDLVVETLPIDGQTASIMRLTIDIGEPELTRVIEARVPVGEGAGIEFLFIWDPSKADDELVMEVISSLRIDEQLIEVLLDSARVPNESSG